MGDQQRHYYLGVDSGQSGTTALIADQNGCVAGMGRGGAGDHLATHEGRERFMNAIRVSVADACRDSELSLETITFAAACFGLTGISEAKEALVRELVRSQRYTFTHDAHIALTGATAGEPGIVVIAGTGSIAYGRAGDGRTARAGGWGYLFGDEGGAFDLARQALRAALQWEEGWGPSTSLHARLLQFFNAASANELLHWFYSPGYGRDRVASFAPQVTAAGVDGDAPAREILRSAARSLFVLAQAVHTSLFAGDKTARIALLGGVSSSPPVHDEFDNLCRAAFHNPPQPPRFMPAAGALLEAFRSDGLDAALSGVPPAGK